MASECERYIVSRDIERSGVMVHMGACVDVVALQQEVRTKGAPDIVGVPDSFQLGGDGSGVNQPRMVWL